jgi:protein-disulfide isomerase
MATNNQGSRAAREAAAAARAQAKAQTQKRERTIQLIGGLAVLVVVAVLVVIAITKKPPTTSIGALPTGVTKDTLGVQVGTAWSASNASSIPKLQIWEDFQCPACKNLEDANGANILSLANSGKVRLEWRPTIFLDTNLQGQNSAAGNPNSSALATMAFGCAVDAGKAEQFHTTLFAHQPQEGNGYSASDLTKYAGMSGINGKAMDTFNNCLSSKKYNGWVQNSFKAFNDAGVTSTPTGVLNGKTLDPKILYTPAELTKAIASATK